MASVLEGIRVLDLSSGIAGPVAGMLLADHGADVVKIERPGGDPFRGSPGYDVWLRGRRSAELDLRDREDRGRFLSLARHADVFLESFAPGTTERLGIDAELLLEQNPRLVVCSITAYGPHAGHRDRPGYDALVAARLGILDEQRGHLGGVIPHLHGEEPFLADLEVPDGMEPGSPRSGPIFTYTPWLSMAAAYLASTGINAALYARLQTDRGQHVETSLLQAALAVTSSKWLRVEHPDAVGLMTWVMDRRAPKGFFKCSDGRWVEQWVPNPHFVLSSADGDTLAFRGERQLPIVPARNRKLTAGPLEGITVLDLGFDVAGPYGAQVLADLGANVIKINAWRDPWWHASHIAYGANRNKRSIGIDLKTQEGLAVFHRLLEHADVVHSNMRRDALDRLHCDEESLRQINPDIIYCHTRGFDRGPRSDSPGNDQTGCSLAGVTYEDGGTGDGGKTFWSLTSLGDTGNGFLSAIGVIQALYHRRRTGEAQSVDTSILNAGLLAASMTALKPDGTPLPRPHLDRSQLGLHPLYRLYETGDGWLCLAAVEDRQWHRLLDALGQPSWADDSRFSDAAVRSAHGIELAALLESVFRTKTSSELFSLLDEHGVPCEIPDADFSLHVFDDPEMQTHELVTEYQHPKVGRYENYGRTIFFSDTPSRIVGPPPLCGQHTRVIMHEHGYDDNEVDKLVEIKAIFEELWVD